LDEISTPPHFPVDRIIQVKLAIKEESSDFIKWTTLDKQEPYMRIIDLARKKQLEGGYTSLAEWELAMWSNQK